MRNAVGNIVTASVGDHNPCLGTSTVVPANYMNAWNEQGAPGDVRGVKAFYKIDILPPTMPSGIKESFYRCYC